MQLGPGLFAATHPEKGVKNQGCKKQTLDHWFQAARWAAAPGPVLGGTTCPGHPFHSAGRRELGAVQQMQAQFDPEKMRQAEVIASMTAKHRNMKPEAEDSTDGYYRAPGKWRPTPLIEAIRKRQWQQAAKLLAWSQVGRAQGHDALMETRTANTHGRPLLKRGGSWSKEMSKRRDANPNYERPK